MKEERVTLRCVGREEGVTALKRAESSEVNAKEETEVWKRESVASRERRKREQERGSWAEGEVEREGEKEVSLIEREEEGAMWMKERREVEKESRRKRERSLRVTLPDVEMTPVTPGVLVLSASSTYTTPGDVLSIPTTSSERAITPPSWQNPTTTIAASSSALLVSTR